MQGGGLCVCVFRQLIAASDSALYIGLVVIVRYAGGANLSFTSLVVIICIRFGGCPFYFVQERLCF